MLEKISLTRFTYNFYVEVRHDERAFRSFLSESTLHVREDCRGSAALRLSKQRFIWKL